ncbi:MAG: peptidylprolyl isomerase [Clostridia bacterium]|nr:peptidylprolyl isomerase [Clostridia bacterium]
MLANFAIAKAVENVKVTDEDAKKFFEENKSQLVSGESVNASHILVDSEEKANEILAKINAGEISFEDAARANSSCPSSEQGGNLGEFTRGQMVPEFDEACFSMAVGEVRGPVKTQFGYHLIKLNAKNEAAPLEYDAIADQIKQKLVSDKQQEAYRSKINQLKILYPVDIL